MIQITIDTESKEIIANIDGEKFTDVHSAVVMCYRDYDDEEEVSVSLSMKPEEISDLTKRVTVCTANSKEGKEALSAHRAEFITKDEQLVKFTDTTSLSESVAKLLNSNKKKL